jgi:hypothetical protein
MQKNRLMKYSIAAIVVTAAMLLVFGATAGAVVGDTTAPVVTSVTPADGSTIYTNGAQTAYYQLGNSTPMQIRATYEDEVGGSGIDVFSIMVHLDIGNMLFDCPTQTDSQVACNATAADLPPGLHPIDIYVDDLAGNSTIHRSYVTVTTDDVAPTYDNLAPAAGSTIYTSELNSTSTNDMGALRFDYDIIDPEPSSGVVPMSHVNDGIPAPSIPGAMISNASCVKTPDATNTTHYSCQVNRAKLLHLGDNTLSVLLKDHVGNKSVDYESGDYRPHYNVVDDVSPSISGITADASTISASYSDPLPEGASSTSLASGINAGTAMIHVDGTMIMMGCTADDSGISCPTPSGLAPGNHGVMIMVSDNDGNMGVGMGTLYIEAPACTTGKPSLSLAAPSPFWGSYADYSAGTLSVTWTINNNGSDDANNVQITASVPSGGVTLETSMPASVGNISGGGSGGAVLQYHVPAGVGSFHVSNTASAEDGCGNGYTYP